MKQRSTITYIKNNKEKTITLNKLNQQVILNQLFYNHLYDGVVEGNYEVRKEITYLEIKNYQFNKHATITSINPETTIILDSCIFDSTIELTEGSYQVIHPTFTENEGNIIGNSIEDLIIDINPNEKNDIDLFIDDVTHFTLNGNNNYQGYIELGKIEDLFINKVQNKETATSISPCPSASLDRILSILNDKTISICISSSVSKTKITDSALESQYLSSKYLELKNAKIYSKQDLTIKTQNLVGENFSFETTGQKITIGKNNYYKPSNQEKLIITENDFLTPNTTLIANTNFIAFLNKLKEELLTQKQERLTEIEQQLTKKKIKSYRLKKYKK